MKAENFDVKALLDMVHSSIRNYAVPGLTSSLIGMPSPCGTVRLFECSRNHQESITPHSHRFDFQCWVLRGHIRNRLWEMTTSDRGDAYSKSTLKYCGSIGNYEIEDGLVSNWCFTESIFDSGQCYSMKAHEVHSIYFSRGAVVLFFEGPTKTDTSIILEPFVHGSKVPTFKVEPWMFQKTI